MPSLHLIFTFLSVSPTSLQYVRDKCPRANLPPLYALELLTVYAWEAGTQEDTNFRLDEGLATVMELLQDYELICIYWTKYYSLQNPVIADFVRKQLKRERYWATALSKSGRKSRETGVRRGLSWPVGQLLPHHPTDGGGAWSHRHGAQGVQFSPAAASRSITGLESLLVNPKPQERKLSLLLRDTESASGTPPRSHGGHQTLLKPGMFTLSLFTHRRDILEAAELSLLRLSTMRS